MGFKVRLPLIGCLLESLTLFTETGNFQAFKDIKYGKATKKKTFTEC